LCSAAVINMTQEKSFLATLFEKRAAVEKTGANTGKNVQAAIKEVDRQIKQCLTGGNLLTGEGVTKSGKED